MRRLWRELKLWTFPPPTKMSGFAASRTDTFNPRDGMRKGASSTGTTRTGAKPATPPSTRTCSNLAWLCRKFGRVSGMTWHAPALPREKVLATVVRLLETTLIRVSNKEYARENHHYGLTTLHNRHLEVEGATLHFHFRGKSGKMHAIDLQDRRLAGIVKRLRDLPGYELFQYLDENGESRNLEMADVNTYLHEIAGEEFTAKDFRNWAGTVLAALALQEYEAVESETQAKRNVADAIKAVAQRLGNTPAICRKCYVHPAVLDSYLAGTLTESVAQTVEEANASATSALKAEETAVMLLLERLSSV